jgi:hypothetical protein
VLVLVLLVLVLVLLRVEVWCRLQWLLLHGNTNLLVLECGWRIQHNLMRLMLQLHNLLVLPKRVRRMVGHQ